MHAELGVCGVSIKSRAASGKSGGGAVKNNPQSELFTVVAVSWPQKSKDQYDSLVTALTRLVNQPAPPALLVSLVSPTNCRSRSEEVKEAEKMGSDIL